MKSFSTSHKDKKNVQTHSHELAAKMIYILPATVPLGTLRYALMSFSSHFCNLFFGCLG